MRRSYNDPCTIEKCAPDLERRGIKGNRRKLQEHFVGREAYIIRILHQAHNSAMRDAYTFRAACRAVRVHHVSKIIGISLKLRIGGTLLGDFLPLGVQANGACAGPGKITEQPLLDEQDWRLGILEHEAQTFHWVI